ncbi:hypothetical protein [Pseudomonas sp. CGJS7]|uniref:hypothetical protein n=1 Tax=Pseudomonas sp. CGJS7 TaxID=3109348 RepID=UPI0030094193
MDDALLILGPVAVLAWNALLWHWSRGYLRYAAVAMFVLNLLIGSPLLGVLCWNLARQDIETSMAGADGDALVAIGTALFNGVVALIGAVAVVLRKPKPASPERAERTKLRSD